MSERKRPVTFTRWVGGGWYDHYRQHGWHALTRWQGYTWSEYMAQQWWRPLTRRWRELWQLVPGGIQ